MCKDDKGDPLVRRLKVLANTVNQAIIGALAHHKPEPVPVRMLAEETGIPRSSISGALSRLRDAQFVVTQGRQKGYIAESAQIRAIIGLENYTRITQGFGPRQNEDMPGQS